MQDTPQMNRRRLLSAIFGWPICGQAQTNPPVHSLEAALADPGRASTLILDKVPLRGLPDDLQRLTQLETLVLHRNGLITMTRALGELKALRAIYLGGSPALAFDQVIELLARLPHLEGVGLDDNRLGSVPRNIGQLRACRRLGLSSNELTDLPRELNQLGALEVLDLYNNRLRRIPAVLREIATLKKVFVKDCGLGDEQRKELQTLLPNVMLNQEIPPELYLQLK